MTSTTPLVKKWILVLSLCGLVLPGRAQVLTDPVVQQTILKTLDNIYNFEFAQSESLIRQIQARYPQHPIGPVLRATQLELQYLPLHENKTATAQFVQAANQGLDLARKLLDKNENDPEGVFFALTAHSYLASLHNNKNETIKAVGESKKAYNYLREGFLLVDKSPDFHFTSGLYNYYIERYPMDHSLVRPFLIFFADGDMAQGLKQMDMAAKKGLFMRPIANYYLAHIYLKHEMNPSRAAVYTTYLSDKYPNNPLFAMIHAEALLLTGRYADARTHLQRLKQLPHKLVPLAVSTFTGMLAEYADKNDKEAAEAYEMALRLPVNDPYTKEYHAFAYAGLARIAARANDRNRAKLYYKKVLAVAQYKSLIREAKAYK
ncbi:tetratricopeptide repeat protein [Spirosoma areae]